MKSFTSTKQLGQIRKLGPGFTLLILITYIQVVYVCIGTDEKAGSHYGSLYEILYFWYLTKQYNRFK